MRRWMRHGATRWDMHFGPNTTPMADVILVMLIFFMAGVALVGPKVFLTASLPTPGAGPAVSAFTLPPATFTVRLTRSETGIEIRGLGADVCMLTDIGDRLHTLTGGAPSDDIIVTVRPDADVPIQAVIDVQDACRAAGIRRTALVTLESDG